MNKKEEVKSILMKIGGPELYKNYKKQIDSGEMTKIVNKKTGTNPNFIYSDDDSDYVTESDISSEEEEMTYAEMIADVVKSENDFYYLE